MKIFIMVAAAAMTFSSNAVAAGAVLSGMYRLVSEQRTIVMPEKSFPRQARTATYRMMLTIPHPIVDDLHRHGAVF
jgi:hypothetical protein